MATVTGYTAARMQEIEDSTVVDGHISGNNLILEKRDGGTIDAGNVRGPQGDQGDPGGFIIGEVRMTIFELTDPDWFLLNGQTITDAETTYPYFYSIAPDSWKSGPHINLPDATRKHLIGGDNPGELGGSDFIALATTNLPSHTHGDGSLAASSAGAHTHNTDPQTARSFVSASYGLVDGEIEKVTFGAMATSSAGAHTHDVSGATGATGGGTPYEHRPQYMMLSLVIYVGPPE